MQMALLTKAEAGIQKATVELERQMINVELEERRCLTEPDGWRDEVQLEQCSPELADGRRLTNLVPEGQGSMAELVDSPPRMRGGS